jgi:hypothetical protein
MPYFHSISKAVLRERRAALGKPDPDKVETNEHEPRTLDEMYFTGLNHDQLAKRNDTQVISRLAGSGGDNVPVLMVPELWLWNIDNFIITAVTADLSSPDPVSYLNSEFKDGNIDAGDDISTLQLTALILSECINFIDRPCCAGLSEPIFYVFENAVAITFDYVQNYMDIKDIRNITMDKEKDFIYNINDIRDEIAMIKNVIEQQEEVWNSFYTNFKDEIESWDSDVYALATRPNSQLPRFKRRIERIIQDAERVNASILTLLDLKSKHASMKESRDSATLNTVAIGFTVIAIVFTPLSFISGLLTLPIDILISNNSNTYSSGFVAKWMGALL